MKTFTLNQISKSVYALLIALSFSTATYATAISAAQSGDWNATSTWTGGAVPVSTDDVTISGFTVTVSDTQAAQSISVQSDATTAGKLIVLATGSLTASTSLNALTLKGGEVENAGTINLTTTDVAAFKYCISFENTVASMLVTSGKYSGAGSLILNSSTSTSGGAINFIQSNADGIFTVGGSYTLSIAAGRPIFNVGTSGKGLITGTGTITAGTSGTPAAYGLTIIAGNNAQLTIDPNVVLNTYTSISTTKRGPIYFAGASPTTLTNKGTIKIEGSGTNAIGSVSSGSNTLNNQGIITISGAFTESAIGINLTTSNVLYIINSGTISISGLPTGVTALATPGTVGYLTITNNTNGVFDVNVASTENAASTRTRIKNYGGTIKGSGIYNGAFEPSTGIVSPGGNGIGKITLKQLSIFTTSAANTNNLTGKCLMDINGKTTAGTDYDQIAFIQGVVDITGATLEASVGGGYSPVLADKVNLLSGTSITGNFSSTVLPANSTLDYSVGTFVSLTFGTTSTKLSNENNVRVFNATGKIIIENGMNKSLKIYSVDGKVLRSEIIKSNSESIKSARGIYLVQIDNVRTKVLVQ